MAETISPETKRLLKEAGIHTEPLFRRLLERLSPSKTLPPFEAEAVQDVRTFQPTEDGGGFFGHWQIDANGLPGYKYVIDQYDHIEARYPNSANLDRRDHWHQIGNDRVTGLVSNDGTVQVYVGDRGGVFLNLFAARDEATLPTDQPLEQVQSGLLAILRAVLTILGRLYLEAEVWLRRQQVGKPTAQDVTIQQVHSAVTDPRSVPTTQAPALTAQAASATHEPSRFAYAGGFGYVNDDTETWSTAYRYRAPNSDIQRVFGLGYAETITMYRNIRVTRRVYAPYGDYPFFLTDLEFENIGTAPANLSYTEYWDINVYQLKLQWLRGNPFGAGGDAERSAINSLFLPQIAADDEWHALRFHQKATGSTIDPSAVSEIDYSPADIFLADLTGNPAAQYTDKFAFFGKGSPSQPEVVQKRSNTIPNAPSTDSMPYCMAMRRDITLAPGEKQTQRYAFGTVRPEASLAFLSPFRQDDWLGQTINDWKSKLIYYHATGDAVLKREMAWHAYYLLSASVYNAYYQTHLIPQGSAYLYIHGADGAPRDQALFTIPLVYVRPGLARETLRLIMSLQHHQTGAIPYSFCGYGSQSSAFIHDLPSDLDLFFLFALNEYLAATGDMDFLRVEIPFYTAGETPALPPGAHGKTVLDHARTAVTHLILKVGTGSNKLIKVGDGDWSDGVVFDSVTRAAGASFPIWFANSKANGESIPNTQMALYVLPLAASMFESEDPALSQQIRQFMTDFEEAVHKQWNGRWYTRAILRDAANKPVALDNDVINLEAQPWALISGTASRKQTEADLIRSVTTLLDDPSQTGIPALEAGLIWSAISQLMTWGYCRSRPDLAWRSLVRNSFTAHASVFPKTWVNIWSGPDAVYCPTSKENPGGTWHTSATPMTDFPVMNANPHAMALLGLLRTCGIEPTADGKGLDINPHVPRAQFTLDTSLIRIDVSPGSIAGEYRAIANGQRTLVIHMPITAKNVRALVDNQAVTVNQSQSDRAAINLAMTAGKAIPFEVRWDS